VSEAGEPARLVNVRRFLMGITANKSDDVLSLLAPDVVYTVSGHSPLAGVFHGPAEVHEHIDKLFRVTSGLEILKWVDWLVGLTHVAAMQLAQAQGGGVVYRNHHLFLVETNQHDLLTDIRVLFEDQDGADEFFTRIARE
jgi:ketosteroid isomerase-like protein